MVNDKMVGFGKDLLALCADRVDRSDSDCTSEDGAFSSPMNLILVSRSGDHDSPKIGKARSLQPRILMTHFSRLCFPANPREPVTEKLCVRYDRRTRFSVRPRLRSPAVKLMNSIWTSKSYGFCN